MEAGGMAHHETQEQWLQHLGFEAGRVRFQGGIHAHKPNESNKHKDGDFDFQENVISFAVTVEDEHPCNQDAYNFGQVGRAL
jgi:hypothetical protein